jgi:serine/threonine kinase 16
LSSKHIVKCRSFEVFKKSPYSEVWLVLEYYDKGTLWDYFQKLKRENKVLKFNEIVKLFRGVVEGVNAIHEAGFVHRDLKPANILLGPENCPVICDLGSLAEASVKISTKKEAQTLEDLASERFFGDFSIFKIINSDAHFLTELQNCSQFLLEIT